ncbi:hypothetical protein ACP70R_017224 [Stipagrostis hirtigluma subsp. patula]
MRKQKGAEESMETTATAADCEIARLPKELLSASISRTSPRDACRAAAVSQAFRAAADSDAVWSGFLPADLPPLADGELDDPAPPSKKALFVRLYDRPALLADRLVSMWLDRESGVKCYMLSARALQITWGDTPQYWRWIPLHNSKFSEVAKLRAVCWLEIHGKLHSKMLSQNSTYAAYIVFKIAAKSYGLDLPFQDASVSIGERKSTCQVCIYDSDDSEDYDFPREDNAVLPQKRADDWMELEMGSFYNEESDDGEVCISLTETKGGNWKKGLIVKGIEIRAKK